MVTLHIEYPVADFESWKSVFDLDPAARKQAGVRRHRISRPVDETDYVLIDLDFDSVDKAQSLLYTLQQMWGLIEEELPVNAQARVVKEIENREY